MSRHGVQALLSSLNERQREAVTQPVPSASLVLAGPGTGKTRVIVARIVFLLSQSECRTMDQAAKQIVALTFTNKAAKEMKNRVRSAVGDAASFLKVATFHAFCAELLRRFGPSVGVPRNFHIIDSDDTLSLMKEVCQSLPLELRREEKPLRREALDLVDKIAKLKRKRLDPEDYETKNRQKIDNNPRGPHRLLYEAYTRYQERLKKSRALDFSDLLWRVYQLLHEKRVKIDGVRHLLIDEFQDTNDTQFLIASKLAQGHAKPSIFAVGDADQSIYSWRGAAARSNFDAFRRTFSKSSFKQVILNVNYRSTPSILRCSDQVILASVGNRVHKHMQSHAPAECAPVEVVKLDDAESEARHIAEFLSSRRGKTRAVLYRTNAMSRRMEEALRNHRLAYRLVGATSFFAREEVKDVVAYLRVVADPQDDLSFSRIVNKPSRGVGPSTLKAISSVAESARVSLFRAARLLSTSVPGWYRGQVPF
ncbi:MAG: hypothetical protein MHM6MM_007087 [Cercozoa sp. M6MM]